jgi:hypothetical protein
LNLQQRQWLEFIQDYDLGIKYDPEKANVVADAQATRSIAMWLLPGGCNQNCKEKAN